MEIPQPPQQGKLIREGVETYNRGGDISQEAIEAALTSSNKGLYEKLYPNGQPLPDPEHLQIRPDQEQSQ